MSIILTRNEFMIKLELSKTENREANIKRQVNNNMR
jgi:hypothetical protein